MRTLGVPAASKPQPQPLTEVVFNGRDWIEVTVEQSTAYFDGRDWRSTSEVQL